MTNMNIDDFFRLETYSETKIIVKCSEIMLILLYFFYLIL